MGFGGFCGCNKGCGDDNGIFFIVLIIILCCCCDSGFGGIGKGCGKDDSGLIWLIIIIALLCLCNPGFGGVFGLGGPKVENKEIGA